MYIYYFRDGAVFVHAFSGILTSVPPGHIVKCSGPNLIAELAAMGYYRL